MSKLFCLFLLVHLGFVVGESSINENVAENYECPADCVDIWTNCQQLVQYCQNATSGAVVRAKCPCTCQVCVLPTTLPPSEIPTTTVPTVDFFKCRPVNLIFVLDYSQTIDPYFYNTSVRAFVKKIASGYPMKGEIDEPSSNIGVVQFKGYANVTYPLIERTRQEFLDTIDAVIYMSIYNQGMYNISSGLEVAINEFENQGIAPHDNVMVILMTEGVSTLDIRQTQPSADRVRAYTEFFAGVGINGVNGNQIAYNSTNMGILIGNHDHAFADIPHAEDLFTGIWPKSRKTYPCQDCKGIIFVEEMTETIGQTKKVMFLNLTKQIASWFNVYPGDSTAVDELEFAIATYGNGTIRPVQFQKFVDFNNDLDKLINGVISENNPNPSQTFASDILKNLYEIVTSNRLKNYLVLFMGESENISDVKQSADYATKLAQTSAHIFVLDLTRNSQVNEFIFKYLVKNDLTKIYNYSNQSVAELTSYYTQSLFGQIWQGMTCNLPLKCRSVNLIFVTSFNSWDAQAFIKKIASAYPMKDEISEPSSRIGIVEVGSDANVSYPLIERTRQEFLDTIDSGFYRINGTGITNYSVGLDTALNELKNQGIAPFDNVMVILMTDLVSLSAVQQMKAAADRVREYTKFFAAVDSFFYTNMSTMITLVENPDLAFVGLESAEEETYGIWPESRKFYPCPV